MSEPLNHQIALVTGSSRGIGQAIALRLARAGADIAIHYVRNESLAQETARQIEELGRKAYLFRANLSKLEHIEQLFTGVKEHFGGLDIFISSAASGFNRPAMQQKESGWDYTMDVNAKAFLFGVQQAVPLMEPRGGGRVIAISSQGSSRVLPDYIAVGASKAALESLTRYLAVELASKHIAVNAVSPGLVETDVLKHFAYMEDPTAIERAASHTPAGRLVTPEDVAELVYFLCTPAAEMIRGQVIVIDGGFGLQVPA